MFEVEQISAGIQIKSDPIWGFGGGGCQFRLVLLHVLCFALLRLDLETAPGESKSTWSTEIETGIFRILEVESLHWRYFKYPKQPGKIFYIHGVFQYTTLGPHIISTKYFGGGMSMAAASLCLFVSAAITGPSHSPQSQYKWRGDTRVTF